jgi:curved DNA-binding protein CbpA
LVQGIDLRKLPIGPTEAFVLSHVNGSTNETEIADEAGIAIETVRTTLEELARLGAIYFDKPTPQSPGRVPRSLHQGSGVLRIGPIIEASARDEAQHPAAALYDSRELDEVVDISPDRKRTILDTFYRLESVTHYQILGVDPGADKRAIKQAYFQMVNVFHPDRYFGKSLGAFKTKLERVFARLTEAHDTLTRSGPRAEYDAYLASLSKTRAFDQSDATVQAQIRAIQQQIEEEARALERGHSAPPASPARHGVVPGPRPPSPSSPSSSPSSPSPSSPSSPSPSSPSTPPAKRKPSSRPPRVSLSQRPLDGDARKRALARKLGGRTLSGGMPAVTPQMPVAPQQTEAQERAGEELKRHYEQRLTQARLDRAERFLLNARQSLANKDPISAANALRIAASLVPENAEISARLQEAQSEAESLLSDHYLTQASYEERDGRLAEAARSYARAAVGGPKARTFERAAYCALMAEGDLRLAGEHARRAVALAPDDAQSRVTLARIYVAAGMKQSGLAEFERAATLAPKDDTIRDWIRRLKRGEA